MISDLRQCDGECTQCIVHYTKKHRLELGQKFQISCQGIPQVYLPENLLAQIGVDSTIATAMVDPVTWAKQFLDWHCIDPVGAEWKRKQEEGSLGELPKYEEKQALAGKSIFHRPYQATMLRCSSKRKVFRLGRQLGKTEALCIAILFGMFTHEDFHVVVIAPYQTQIDLVFTRLMALMRSNVMLRNSILRSVKAPNYAIELKNGSRVMGFTAGTRSGQDAGAVRGQHANMLVFDECDFLSAADIDSALAIITNFPDATVWMSSTPTGRRERFYKVCHSTEFKEFHLPSQANPNWTEDLESLFRNTLTADGYIHEVLAEFGEQEEGVYQAKYVEMAQSLYEYGDMKVDSGWHYSIGVDWNDQKVGVCIAVVGFNPSEGTFHVVDKRIVTRSEYTQLSGCDTVASMNRVWRPFAIYVDFGYGATQSEVLKLFGHQSMLSQGPDSPDARLAHILKKYDFGGTMESYDPFTKLPVKKAAKPFLVENSVRRFEQCRMRYPKSDERYTASLLGYIIKRISPTGVPVYEEQNEAVGDHFLDAVNLALVAFTLEKTDFGKPQQDGHIALTEKISFMSLPKESTKSNPDDHRPKLGRAETMKQDDSLLGRARHSIPAAMTGDNHTRIWSWPGFLRDEPKPKPRPLSEALRQARQRVYGASSRPTAPKRQKF